jgi:hypothetical protein
VFVRRGCLLGEGVCEERVFIVRIRRGEEGEEGGE